MTMLSFLLVILKFLVYTKYAIQMNTDERGEAELEFGYSSYARMKGIGCFIEHTAKE